MEEKKPYLDNRELSWLKFNKRVLEEAQKDSVPLFERLKFASIFSNNLDEFFMVRVGYLREQRSLKKDDKKDDTDNKTKLTAREQLKAISKSVRELIPMRDEIYKELFKKLYNYGIVRIDFDDRLSSEDEGFLEEYFKREVMPLLHPAIIDKKHPVPFFQNKEIYVAFTLKLKEGSPKDRDKDNLLSIMSANLSGGGVERMVWLPSNDGRMRFMLAEHLILRYAYLIYDHYEIVDRSMFRATRNADLGSDEALYDHDIDFRNHMVELLKKRKKSAPVRIEFDSSATKNKELKFDISDQLNLNLSEDYIYVQSAALDLSFVFALEDAIKENAQIGGEALSELFFPHLEPQSSLMVNLNESVMKQMEKGDILLSYPYESMRPFIRLLEEASADKDVHSIKITLYRVASDSKIIDALIKAAENGKQVLALLELRARFDEENNINWSKRLEEAGAQVIYGLDELKVHSKLLLITKKTSSETSVRYYTQIGTGNYNEKTGRIYTDFSLMTCDRIIGTDASTVFNALSLGSTVDTTNRLLVAPKGLKSRVVEMIDAEITKGIDGYIGLKLNSLTDKDIIEKLVEASQKGVTVEALIRGICCLVAGVEGYTENVMVKSIVGRFLEHSRVYIFGRGENNKVYISSADFMTRNTERRVEVAVPVRDAALKKRIMDDFAIMLNDNVKARIQRSNGEYKSVKYDENPEELDSQIYFYARAYENALTAVNKKENGGSFWAKLWAKLRGRR